MKVKVKSLSHVQLFAAPWTVVYQAPPSMGFSRQEYWSGVPLPSPTRPFRYDLNLIPYDYTVEVGNRRKALDLIDRVPDELWMEVCSCVQEAVSKTIPKKQRCNNAKWLSEKALYEMKKEEKQSAKDKNENIPI